MTSPSGVMYHFLNSLTSVIFSPGSASNVFIASVFTILPGATGTGFIVAGVPGALGTGFLYDQVSDTFISLTFLGGVGLSGTKRLGFCCGSHPIGIGVGQLGAGSPSGPLGNVPPSGERGVIERPRDLSRGVKLTPRLKLFVAFFLSDRL